HAESPAPVPCRRRMETRAFASAMTAEVAARLEVIDERRGAEVRIVLADVVDKRPQTLRIRRALIPAGKECIAIRERKRDAEIEADQRPAGHSDPQPVEHFVARPATTGADQLRRRAILAAKTDRNASMPLP